MKAIYLLLCLCVVGALKAQEENKNDTNSYRFRSATDIFPAVFDPATKEYIVKEDADPIFSKKKQIFEKIPQSDTESKYYFFRIYSYVQKSDESVQSRRSSPVEDSTKTPRLNNSLNKIYVYDADDNLKTFAITKTSFDQTTTPYYSRYAVSLQD